MSSSAVRTLVKDFLAANSPEDVIDLTAQYDDILEVLSEEGLQPDAPWLGVEFVGDEEIPVSLAATNDQGLYREFGMVQLHVCAVARIGVGASLETRAEALRNLFRGARIGGMFIEQVSPMRTGPGATLEFEAGYVSGTVTVMYKYDFTP